MQELFRSTDLTGRPAFMEYANKIGDGFCSFVQPAQQKSVLFFSEYELKALELEDLQAAIFCLGFIHTELLRKGRRQQTTRMLHDLFCENTIFYLSPEVKIGGPELFGWPHWLLKLLYTKFSILFGKFWKDEQDTSRSGRAIPPPPDHFLSIRSAIKPTDARFFSLAPQLTGIYLTSCDDGTSAFNGVPLSIPPEVLEVESLELNRVSKEYFLYLLNRIPATFYLEMKEWGLGEWRKQQKE